MTTGEGFAVLAPLPDTGARHPRAARAPREARGPLLGGDLGGGRGGRARTCASSTSAMRTPARRRPSPASSSIAAFGLRMVPNLRDESSSTSGSNGVKGWLVDVEPPVPGAAPDQRSACWPSSPTESPVGPSLTGLTIRRVDPDEAVAWQLVMLEAFGIDGPRAGSLAGGGPTYRRDAGHAVPAGGGRRPTRRRGWPLQPRTRRWLDPRPPCCPSPAAAASMARSSPTGHVGPKRSTASS